MSGQNKQLVQMLRERDDQIRLQNSQMQEMNYQIGQLQAAVSQL
jgi:hypothetical protein